MVDYCTGLRESSGEKGQEGMLGVALKGVRILAPLQWGMDLGSLITSGSNVPKNTDNECMRTFTVALSLPIRER